MIIQWCRGLVHLLGGLAAGLAIIIVLLAWHLSKGPVSLAFLTPYIEQTINSRSDQLRLKLGDTILTWAGWERTFDIRMVNVEARDPFDNPIVTFPEVAVSLSGRALLIDGQIAPKSIDLFGPQLEIRRDRDGTFEIGLAPDAGTFTSSDRAQGNLSLLELLDDPTPGSSLSYLSRVNIIGASAVIEDQVLARTWRAPETDIRLERDALGLKGDVTLRMDLGGRSSEVVVVGGYQTREQRLDLGISFADLMPATLATFHEELAPLKSFDIPLSGTITLGMVLGDVPQSVGFELSAQEGRVTLPDMGAGEQTLAVASVQIGGRYDGLADAFYIDVFDLRAAGGTTVLLPGDVGHRMPLSSVSFAGAYSEVSDALRVDQLSLDLAGPKLSFKGQIDEAKTRPRMRLAGSLDRLRVAEFEQYWSKDWAADVYDWIETGILNGVVRNLKFEFDGHVEPDQHVIIDRIDGEMSLEQVDVVYLVGMPAVKNAAGKANFTEKRMDFFFSGGKAEGLEVDKGRLFFTGLNEDMQYADIEADISGKVDDVLRLIDNEPLGYATEMGLDPKGAAGDAFVRLNVTMPMIKDLSLADVEVSADARLTKTSVNGVVRGEYDLAEANLDLAIDKRGMEVRGTGRISGIPSDIVWQENFTENAAFQSIVDLTSRVDDLAQVRALGLKTALLDTQFLDGAANTDVRLTVLNDKETRIEVRADLTPAQITIDAIKWSKLEGVPGRAEINLTLVDGVVQKVPHFALYAGDLAVEGRAVFDAEHRELRRLDFNQVSQGKTDMKGALIKRYDGTWDIGFHGRSLDLSSVWEDIVDGDGDSENASLLSFVAAAEFDEVWLDDERVLKNVSGTLARKDDVWSTILLKSLLAEDTVVDIALKTAQDGNRTLEVDASDAGILFRTFGYYDNMLGGRMRLVGRFDDSQPSRPLKGRMVVRDYRITDAPTMAHVISIMALTGILDALQGDGIGFDVLDTPFVYSDGVLEITDARASGTSLGFTASGRMYTHADVINLKGTIVPAYAVNSVFGRIPVLGDLLTGGEAGSGVFAANFSMSGTTEDPDIAVNPLSALAPGFLRNLFGIFDGVGSSGPAPVSEGNELQAN